MDTVMRGHETGAPSTRFSWAVFTCMLMAAPAGADEPPQNKPRVVSHTEGRSWSGEEPSDSRQSSARSFRLGFTPDDLLSTPEVGKVVCETLSRQADLVAFHLGHGVPWEEALGEKPYPPAVEQYLAKWSRLKDRLRGDRAVYLALTPLKLQRNGLAAYWGGDEAGAKKWRSRAFDDPETILAYTRFCRRMIHTFRPDYFAYGIEANMLAEANPRKYEQFRVLAKQVYETLKAEYPNLPIFLTFQIDLYHKQRL